MTFRRPLPTKVKDDPAQQEEGRDVRYLPDNKLYRQRCPDVGAEDDAQ